MIVLYSNATISSFSKRVSKMITQYGQYFYLQRWMGRSAWVRIDLIVYYITLICNRGYYYSTIEWRRMRKTRVINENFWSTIKAIFHSYSLHDYLNKILSILRSAGVSTCVIMMNFTGGYYLHYLSPYVWDESAYPICPTSRPISNTTNPPPTCKQSCPNQQSDGPCLGDGYRSFTAPCWIYLLSVTDG